MTTYIARVIVIECATADQIARMRSVGASDAFVARAATPSAHIVDWATGKNRADAVRRATKKAAAHPGATIEVEEVAG